VTKSGAICGVDEAGRGPLAGPVYAAAVILSPDIRIAGLADSKLINPTKREALAAEIKKHSASWAVAFASVEEIDEMNILRASLLAMKRAVLSLHLPPTEVLVDGLHCPDIAIRSRAIVKGDRTIPEISAASILAKTARDEEMLRLHRLYPGYGLDRHKGYPTAEHLATIARIGVCDIYRKSFAPVRRALARA
jgi:ribonuclease HII